MKQAAVLTAMFFCGVVIAIGMGVTKTANADQAVSTGKVFSVIKSHVIFPVENKKTKRKKRKARVNKYERYIAAWERRDHDTKAALKAAAFIFKVDYNWLSDCNDAEGGNNDPQRLASNLRTGAQPGWNLSGSSAFGAMQFMMDRKPAPNSGDWGTFEKYQPIAFDISKGRGFWIPARFNTPASNVGQAITAAFMFAAGQSGQWSGAGC
jgi:hypothetical protein